MNILHTAALSILFAVMPATAATYRGSCGNDASWTLEDHTLRISGSGATTDFISPGNINATYPGWHKHKDDIYHVIIEDGITSIGDFSFYKYNKLESAILPEGLTRIGNFTFSGCLSLKGIKLPETTETIGDPLLNYNNNGFSFSNCQSLEEITLPEGLKTISGGSFNECPSLTKVTWNAINCEADVFDPVARYTGIFVGSSVHSVTFGKNVISIPAHSFRDVSSLSEINTPGTISYVGYMAFNKTTWENMQESEKTIYLDKAAYLYKVDEYAVEPIAVTLDPGTKSITDRIFENNERLEKIVIPETVDRIGNKSFIGCSSLTEVEWNPIGIQQIRDYEGSKLFSSALRSIKFGDKVEMLPDKFLSGCTALKEITLPASLKTIGQNAFEQCNSITTLEIPDGVETLGRLAIYNCAKIEQVTIGEGLKTFDYYYFLAACPKLTTLKWNAVRTQSKELDLYHTSDRCGAPIENFIVGEKVDYIPGQLFLNSTTLNNVVLGSSVTEIGSGAFRGCKALTEINLPESLLAIDDNSFYNTGIKHIIIPGKVTHIGTWGLEGKSITQAILLPLKAPEGGSISIGDELKMYVPDVAAYSNSPFTQYSKLLNPLAIADKDCFTQDEEAAVNFTCNIPDHTMTVTSMPELEKGLGEHMAIVEAEFCGEKTFTAKFVYNYCIKPSAGIDAVTGNGSLH